MVRGQRDQVLAAVNEATHVHGEDHKRIDAAMRKVARANDGVIDPNAVRQVLTNKWGLTVDPRVLSARYMALRARKIIIRSGTTINRDTAGRNQGKPMSTYRVINEDWLKAKDRPFVWDRPLFALDGGVRS